MWYNRFMLALLRSPLHGLISRGVLAVTYSGRKSGATYTTPVEYVRDAAPAVPAVPGAPVIFWTLSQRTRVWWRNLRGGAPVLLLVQRRTLPATAEVVETPTAVADALAHYLTLRPGVARFIHIPLHDGAPDPAALARYARAAVVVRFQLGDTQEGI